MSTASSITIQPQDLQKILDTLQAEHVTRITVTIVDAGDRYIIRDTGDFRIGEVIKTEPAEVN